MATLHAFDTLAYTKALVDRGYDRDKAEALAEAQREFFVKELASEEFVRAEIEKAVNKLDNKINVEIERVRHEITASEKRLTMTMGKLIAFTIGILLAGIPIIQAVMQRVQ